MTIAQFNSKLEHLTVSIVICLLAQLSFAQSALCESYGLINNFGKFVVKPEYDGIEYCGNGIYRGRKNNQLFAFDRDGKKLPVKLADEQERQYGKACRLNMPKATKKLQSQYEKVIPITSSLYAAKPYDAMHFLGTDKTGKKLFDLPMNVTGVREGSETTELIVADWQADTKPPEGLLPANAVFNKLGKMIVPPKYCIGQARCGLIEIIEYSIDQDRLAGVMDYNGKWVIPMQLAYFQITEPSRLIKTVRNAHFDPKEWRDPSKQFYRMRNFAHFLKDYDLIGMPKAEVHRLLGPGHNARMGPGVIIGTIESYSLTSGMCGNSGTGFDIAYEGYTVKRWRMSRRMEVESNNNWITENMVFDQFSPYNREKLVPKQQKNREDHRMH